MTLTKNYKILLSFLILFFLSIYLVANYLNSIFAKPITNNNAFIIINKNMSETAFLSYLKKKEINVSKLEWYISKFFTIGKFILKHGEFLISKSNSLIDVLEKINNNDIYYRKFILIEGTNSKQLKRKLIKTPGLIGKVPYLSEGKFKPDTYLYKWEIVKFHY